MKDNIFKLLGVILIIGSIFYINQNQDQVAKFITTKFPLVKNTKEHKFEQQIAIFVISLVILVIPLLSSLIYNLIFGSTKRSSKQLKGYQHVSQINIFPIKSTAEISVGRAFVNKEGLQFDRRFLIVDQDGKFVTGRQCPILTQVQATPLWSGLAVNFKDKKQIFIDIEKLEKSKQQQKRKVTVWDDTTQPVAICEKEVNQWFSEILNMQVELVYLSDRKARMHKDFYVSFADAYPLLLISNASLEYLNKHCPQPVEMKRFRTNIIAEECVKSFEEDTWKLIKIGNVVFENLKPCSRCIFTTVDPVTGIKDKKHQPLDTLMRIRQGEDGQAYFGINLLPKNEGIISVNDQIEILEYQEPLKIKQIIKK